jgi:hypothetical protein
MEIRVPSDDSFGYVVAQSLHYETLHANTEISRPPDPHSMGTRSLFSGVKRPKRGVDHPTPSSAEVKDRVELPLRAFMACCSVNFTLP